MIATDHKCQPGTTSESPACAIALGSASSLAEPQDHSHFENAISRALKASTRPSRQHHAGNAEEAGDEKAEGAEKDVRPISPDDGDIPAPAALHPFVTCQLASLPETSNREVEAKAVSGVLPEAASENAYDQKTGENVTSEIAAGSVGFTDKEADTGINSAQISATMTDPAKTGQNQHALPSRAIDETKSERQVISTLQFDSNEDVSAKVDGSPSILPLDSLSGMYRELPVGTFTPRFDSTPSIVEAPATAGGEIPTAEAASQIVQCAVQMRRHHLETMTVALRPDNHTEIRLDLSVQGEQVNVQAHLERGEFGAMSQRWSELQEELASRGVRLSNLEDFTDSGNGRNFYSADKDEECVKGQAAKNVQRSTPNVQRSTDRAWECWA